jgi:glycosyltransferase involved in cell wall biosynthesis
VQFFTENTTLIIPTRNRPLQILSLLKQIKLFKVKFFEILVIDSSDLENKKFLKKEIRKFEICIYDTPPSTSFQRNFGLTKKSKKTEFVMFLDDDIVLFNNSF